MAAAVYSGPALGWGPGRRAPSSLVWEVVTGAEAEARRPGFESWPGHVTLDLSLHFPGPSAGHL